MPGGVSFDILGGRRVQRELRGQLGHPGRSGGRVEHVAGGVDHDQRSHGDPGLQDRGRGAQTAFQYAGPCAGSAADAADGEVGSGGFCCSVAELSVRSVRPGAHGQVEDHGGGHDRHRAAGHLHAPAVLLEPAHHPVGGRQAEGTAAAEHDRVDVADTVGRVEQFGLLGAGRTPDIDRSDGSGVSGQPLCRKPNRCPPAKSHPPSRRGRDGRGGRPGSPSLR